MNKILPIIIADIVPDTQDILERQGIPPNVKVKNEIIEILTQAQKIFSESAEPVGLIYDISIKEFENVFWGEGDNEEDAPLREIYPQADNLALFALTMGIKVSQKIEDLFNDNDYALGSMLDSVASLAADKAVEVLEQNYMSELVSKNLTSNDNVVLSYSPGYCGWNINGQQKLFKYLKPERISIALNNSCLMSPLKSVTGVLVSGEREIHLFDASYSFCSYCTDRTCEDRREKILRR